MTQRIKIFHCNNMENELKKLSQQDKLRQFCMDVGFLSVVEIGHYFRTPPPCAGPPLPLTQKFALFSLSRPIVAFLLLGESECGGMSRHGPPKLCVWAPCGHSVMSRRKKTNEKTHEKTQKRITDPLPSPRTQVSRKCQGGEEGGRTDNGGSRICPFGFGNSVQWRTGKRQLGSPQRDA